MPVHGLMMHPSGQIEFGDIYTYFIDTPGPFTRDNMREYRSLEAYMFFHCEYKTSRTGFCIIRAKVHRSQAVTLEPHQAWVAIRESDLSVECGHGTCMAGLGEVCSHIAGILFKTEASVRFRQQTSCTSLPCQWNQTFVKKVDGVPLEELKFKKPKQQSVGAENKCYETASLLPSVTDPSSLLQDLKQCAPTAVVFSVVNPK